MLAVMKSSVLLFGISMVVWKVLAYHTESYDETEKDSVSIVFGGDIDFSRITQYEHDKRKCSYSGIFDGLRRHLKSADFAIVNLETVIKEHGKTNKYSNVNLYSDESVLLSLKQAHVTGVTLANNHISDYREIGTNITIQLLDKFSIGHVGTVVSTNRYAKQEPLILEKNGIRIGIVAYCDLRSCQRKWQGLTVGPAMVKVSAVISQVKALREKKECDIVILFMHWGTEYSNVIPLNVLMLIRNLLRVVHIDVIVGSHPHVPLKHWYIGNTLIAPSLGNLIFTPFGLANFNFNTLYRERRKDALYERIWYKQMQVMQNPTGHGRLLRLKFNKGGIIRDESQYLNTKVSVTKQHCLYVGKDENAKWTTICDAEVNDKECIGTDDCNYLICNGEEIYPENVKSDYPPWRSP